VSKSYRWLYFHESCLTDASFSENFYGLKRRRRPYIETERAKAAVGGVPVQEKLRPREIGRSLLLLVGIPYLRAKAQDYYEELGGGVSSDILNEGMDVGQIRALTDDVCTYSLFLQGSADMVLDLQGFKGRLRRSFKTLYPWLNTSFELWLLIYNVAYLFDQTPFYRPWLSWIGIDLRRLGVEDFVSFDLLSLHLLLTCGHSVLPPWRLKRARCWIRDVGRLLDYDVCSLLHHIYSWTRSGCCYQQLFSSSSSWSGGILLDRLPGLCPHHPWDRPSLPRKCCHRTGRAFRLTRRAMGHVRSVKKASTMPQHYPLAMFFATDVHMTKLRGTGGVQLHSCQLEGGS
jgi:Pex2 / Pex12 amino terminal region